MEKLVFTNTSSYIYLTKTIYNRKNIEASIKTYLDFLHIKINDNGKYTILKLDSKTKDYTIKQLTKELLNNIIYNEHSQK